MAEIATIWARLRNIYQIYSLFALIYCTGDSACYVFNRDDTQSASLWDGNCDFILYINTSQWHWNQWNFWRWVFMFIVSRNRILYHPIRVVTSLKMIVQTPTYRAYIVFKLEWDRSLLEKARRKFFLRGFSSKVYYLANEDRNLTYNTNFVLKIIGFSIKSCRVRHVLEFSTIRVRS